MRSNLIALTTILGSGSSLLAAELPMAWITFEEQAVQKYDNVPYLWLGEQPIYLMIDLPPADGHMIDLLWGSKDDQRGAEVVINKKRQRVQAGGYNGFRWQRVKLPEGSPSRRIREEILSYSTPGGGRVYNNHRCEAASAQGSSQVENLDWLPTAPKDGARRFHVLTTRNELRDVRRSASQLPFFRDESLEG